MQFLHKCADSEVKWFALLENDAKDFLYPPTRLTTGKTLEYFHSNKHQSEKINVQTNCPVLSVFSH